MTDQKDIVIAQLLEDKNKEIERKRIQKERTAKCRAKKKAQEQAIVAGSPAVQQQQAIVAGVEQQELIHPIPIPPELEQQELSGEEIQSESEFNLDTLDAQILHATFKLKCAKEHLRQLLILKKDEIDNTLKEL